MRLTIGICEERLRVPEFWQQPAASVSVWRSWTRRSRLQSLAWLHLWLQSRCVVGFPDSRQEQDGAARMRRRRLVLREAAHVRNLHRPGGNITGFCRIRSHESDAKMLQRSTFIGWQAGMN